jgi:hypothetical protein
MCRASVPSLRRLAPRREPPGLAPGRPACGETPDRSRPGGTHPQDGSGAASSGWTCGPDLCGESLRQDTSTAAPRRYALPGGPPPRRVCGKRHHAGDSPRITHFIRARLGWQSWPFPSRPSCIEPRPRPARVFQPYAGPEEGLPCRMGHVPNGLGRLGTRRAELRHGGSDTGVAWHGFPLIRGKGVPFAGW